MLNRRSFIGAVPALYGLAKATALPASSQSKNTEYHVSENGDDSHDGSPSRMLRTISAASARAYPGDVITVHKGVYRERVTPPRGGTSDAKRIVYQAAPGERPVITGAEIMKGWVKVKNDVWKVSIPNSFFKGFNPYSDLIHGDWFEPKGRQHHTGAVYLNGDWFVEAAKLEDVLAGTGLEPLWFGHVDEHVTTIWAQFKGVDPNTELTEINVRKTVFYPEKTGMNYITVRGFILRQAATPWAPPTAEQIGVIGAHWSRGWIIEDNIVSHSTCSGISLGKYGDEFDNTSANSAEGYVKTIERATKFGWSKESVGSHLVRGNTVSHCEQAGIVGSLGPVFSVVTGNTIHDIHIRRLFTGAEMAGIKFHAAIDVEISHNHIYHTNRGLWLDWMAQGTHVHGNLFHHNQENEDLMVEVDHGPFLVDNNIFLSGTSQRIVSQGGAYAHNLFCGGINLTQFDRRLTPFLKAHSTEVAGLHDNPSGDMRFYNNVFAQSGDLSPYNQARLPMSVRGNVFLGSAKPSTQETTPLLKPDFDPAINLTNTDGVFHLQINLDSAWATERRRKLVTSDLLGMAMIPHLPFVRADNTSIRVDTDYSGRPRNPDNPFPGPFENPEGGKQSILIRTTKT
ncbi:MAG TPA: right-handed parallel beta-helix repeat-containing protein [Acidobacteriaceae bacterium]|nr:right-handed parallel beta-helix repeat-containing protein [Acidobacteriaceae bacterium]